MIDARAAPRPLAMIRVHFREIPALHDLRCFLQLNGRGQLQVSASTAGVYAKPGDVAQLAYRLPGGNWFGTTGEWIEDRGPPSAGVEAVSPFPDGVYRNVHYCDRSRFVLQTFTRKDAMEIQGRWLYVFQAGKHDGSGAMLVKEVWVEDRGTFRIATRAASGGTGPVALGAPGPSWLDLPRERAVADGWRECFYFAYLNPYQLTMSGIEKLAKDIGVRGSALGDPFCTDVMESNRPVPMALASTKRPVAFMLYVLDVAREAGRRAHVYDEAIIARDTWRVDPQLEACEVTRNPNNNDRVVTQKAPSAATAGTYVLSKHLQAMTQGSPDLASLVEPRLTDYIRHNEQRRERIQFALLNTTQDHASWCLERRRLVPIIEYSLESRRVRVMSLTRQGGKVAYVEEREDAVLDDRPPISPFSRFVRDHVDAEWGVKDEVTADAVALHLPLRETSLGRSWLEANFAAVEDHEQREGDGGIAVAVEMAKAFGKDATEVAKRSPGHKTPATALGLIVAAYSDVWAYKYRDKALESFDDWLCVIHGVSNRSEVDKALRREAYPRFAKARSDPGSSARNAWPWLKKMEEAKKWAKRWEFVMKAIVATDTIFKVATDEKLRSNPWEWAELAGKLADLGESAIKLRDNLKPLVEPGGFAPIKLGTTILFVTLKARKLEAKYDRGDHDGAVMQLLGTALAGVSESLMTANPYMAIGLAVGLALQYAGEKYADQYNATKRYLRWCMFGEPNAWDLHVDDTVDEPWFPRVPDPGKPGRTKPGSARALRTSAEFQQRVFWQIKFDFELRVFVRDGNCAIRVRPRNLGALSVTSAWRIQLYRKKQNGKWEENALGLKLELKQEKEYAFLEAYFENLHRNGMHAPGEGYAPEPAIVWVTLDAFGDGQVVVKRGVHPELSADLVKPSTFFP